MTAFAVESAAERPPGVQPPEGLTDTGIGGIGMADRTDRTCAVKSCVRRVFSREWCQMHYTRWLRHGDPTKTHSTRDIPIEQRVDAQIDRRGPDECWPWTGALTPVGYAAAHLGPERSRLVHRFMYERLVGPIPDGLTLDHLCHTADPSCKAGDGCPHRRCVNPAHLEPVTVAENNSRSHGPNMTAVRTDRCARGHDLTVHGYIRKDKPGRNCNACQRITSQLRRDHLRAQGINPYKPRRKRDAA